MQQHAAALDMAEETIAEANTLMRAFDQAWDIGKHEFTTVGVDHAKLRVQRRKWVVGDLRFGRTHRGEKGRFAGIRQPDNAGIGDQFKPKPQRVFFARLAGIGIPRRAVGRTFEMRIAEAAIAAAQQHNLLRPGSVKSAISVDPSSS